METPASLLRQVRQRCGLVLVLGPHWDGRPDAAALAAACDVVYLVLPEQEAGSPQVDELLQAIPRRAPAWAAASSRLDKKKPPRRHEAQRPRKQEAEFEAVAPSEPDFTFLASLCLCVFA